MEQKLQYEQWENNVLRLARKMISENESPSLTSTPTPSSLPTPVNSRPSSEMLAGVPLNQPIRRVTSDNMVGQANVLSRDPSATTMGMNFGILNTLNFFTNFFFFFSISDEFWMSKARILHPEPFPKPSLNGLGNTSFRNVNEDYAEYMKKKYEYEQWENLVLRTAKKLQAGQLALPEGGK